MILLILYLVPARIYFLIYVNIDLVVFYCWTYTQISELKYICSLRHRTSDVLIRYQESCSSCTNVIYDCY